MFKFVTGDLLKSNAYALVNTVNCEGYMGKGIAYQFKLQFPEMNKDYVSKCKKKRAYPRKITLLQYRKQIYYQFPDKKQMEGKIKNGIYYFWFG